MGDSAGFTLPGLPCDVLRTHAGVFAIDNGEGLPSPLFHVQSATGTVRAELNITRAIEGAERITLRAFFVCWFLSVKHSMQYERSVKGFIPAPRFSFPLVSPRFPPGSNPWEHPQYRTERVNFSTKRGADKRSALFVPSPLIPERLEHPQYRTERVNPLRTMRTLAVFVLG